MGSRAARTPVLVPLLFLLPFLAASTSLVPVKVRAGESGRALTLSTDANAGKQIADPTTLFGIVSDAWDQVVEPNQAGLSPAKNSGSAPPPASFSKEEAWHHYSASRAGVVDSARFLLVFGAVPSLQTEGTQLHAAAARGDAAEVRGLIEDGDSYPLVDVSQPGGDSTTPLLSAATMGHSDVVKLLLQAGASPESRGVHGASALHIASAMGHLDVMMALLDGGADPDAVHTFADTTAIHFASEMGNGDAIRLLCSKGANPEAAKRHGGTAMHTAADSNQTASVLALLDPVCGPARVNGVLLNNDTSPLYLAAQRGHDGVASTLIEAGGADVNFEMPSGHFSGQVAVVSPAGGGDELAGGGRPNGLFYSGDPNSEIGNGATALHAAVENGHPTTVALLLGAGAKQLSSMEGASPLIIAAQYNQARSAGLLIAAAVKQATTRPEGEEEEEEGKKRKPRRDLREAKTPKDGGSALYHAVTAGHESVFDVLIKGELDPNSINRRGSNTLAVAAALGRASMARKLIAAGANAAHADPSGWTALHAAAQGGHAEIVVGLVVAGGGDYAAGGGGGGGASQPAGGGGGGGGEGQTALHIACESGRWRVVEALLTAPSKVAPPPLLRHYVEMPMQSTGATAVAIASKAGCEECVKLLLQKGGAEPNAPAAGWYGAMPIFFAAQNGHDGVVRLLLSAGSVAHPRLKKLKKTKKKKEKEKETKKKAPSKTTDTNSKHISPQPKAVLSAVEQTAEQAATLLGTQSLLAGVTPLFVACEGGHTTTVETLLSQKAVRSGINMKRAHDGRTALHAACGNGGRSRRSSRKGGSNSEGQGQPIDALVALLLSKGAKSDQEDKAGDTPLIVAARGLDTYAANALLSAAFNDDSSDAVASMIAHSNHRGDTALHAVIGAIVDATSSSGQSVPGKRALKVGIAMAQGFLKAGGNAAASVTNKDGLSAYDSAVAARVPELLKVFSQNNDASEL